MAKQPKQPERKCVNGKPPDEVALVPAPEHLDNGFQVADGLKAIADGLIDGDVFFDRLRNVSVLWLWRDKLPSTKAVVAKTVADGSILSWAFSKSEIEHVVFTVELDAGKLRAAAATNWQIEWLVFRGLRYLDLEGKAPRIREREFEGFADEFKYGAVTQMHADMIQAGRLAPGWEQPLMRMQDGD